MSFLLEMLLLFCLPSVQPEDLRPVIAMLFRVCRNQLLNSRDGRIDGIDSIGRLATGILFHEGNRSVRKDFLKFARTFDAGLKAGNTGTYYYFGMRYRSGTAVQNCGMKAFECFEKSRLTKDANSMAQLSVCYLFGDGVEVGDSLGIAYAIM